MEFATAEQLLAPQPLKEETHELEGIGKVRIVQLSMAERTKCSLWLYPDGKLSKKRQSNYGLKMATECLRNGQGDKLFEFPDTKEGNKAFFEFAAKVNDGAPGHWVKILNWTDEVNGEAKPDIEGKSED